jgi:hypothetical protein
MKIVMVPVEFPEQIQGAENPLEDGTKQLRRVPKTLPVASKTVWLGLDVLYVQIPELPQVFLTPIAARISVAVLGINKEEVYAPPAGIGRRRVSIHVLPAKRIQ